MFAVPGWSVPSSNLKTQATDSPVSNQQSSGGVATGETSSKKPSRKRKRQDDTPTPKNPDINPTNFADLWEKHIENGGKSKKKKKSRLQEQPDGPQSQIESSDHAGHEGGVEEETTEGGLPIAEADVAKIGDTENAAEPKKRKKQKKISDEVPTASDAKPEETQRPKSKTDDKRQIAVEVPKPVTKLTPLQTAMRQKLISARFRHLNQTLYTTPSAKSLALFHDNPEMFQEYHEGFRLQVGVWPENPIDGYIAQIRLRGKQAAPGRGAKPVDPSSVAPLPRTEGTCHIADLGCGDAALSQGLEKEKKKLKLAVYSYDLQSPNKFVTKADVAALPLQDDSIDIAVFCLALMGTNWVDFIEEASRILRWKGELWIAEIKSRFGRVSGKGQRVEHSVGNKKKPDKKLVKKREDDADEADLMVVVDGHEDKGQETDVSAFIEVLRKRGFVLQSENSVDLSNRMFVKMTFVKGLTPVKGKCVPMPKDMEKMGQGNWRNKPRFVEKEEEDVHVSSEAGVLKPCVYKLR